MAAQGLHGLEAFFAAHGLQGLQAFFAAHGLQGLQAFFAAQGLQAFLPAQGLQAFLGAQVATAAGRVATVVRVAIAAEVRTRFNMGFTLQLAW